MGNRFDPYEVSPRGSSGVLMVGIAAGAVLFGFLAAVVMRSGETSGASTDIAPEVVHTCEGAAGAVATYLQRFHSPEAALSVEGAKQAIEETTVGPARERLLEALQTEIAPIARGAAGQQYRAGVETLQMAVPIGYEIKECEPDLTRVVSWSIILRGNVSNVPPMQFWMTQDTTVEWIDGKWLITDGSVSDGPIPYWTQHPPQSRSKNQKAVMGRASGMKAFDVVP